VRVVYAKDRDGERERVINKSPRTYPASAIDLPARRSGLGGYRDDGACILIHIIQTFAPKPRT
jgi:hypothetical protein